MTALFPPNTAPAPVSATAPRGARAAPLSAALPAPATAFTDAPSAAGSTAPVGGDFDTYLKMLTTQIKNQDPLNPMEGSDFAVQLATFSGVEQQVRTNALLSQLVGEGAGNLSALAHWIGKEVRTTAPVAFQGRPLTMQIDPARDADQVTLVTLDASGAEVLREDIGTGTGEVDWSGRRADGTALAHARYSFRLESALRGEVIATTNVGVFAPVTGAELTAQGTRLTLAGGASTLESEVTALRERGS